MHTQTSPRARRAHDPGIKANAAQLELELSGEPLRRIALYGNGASDMTASKWRRGLSVAEPASRIALEEKWGIPRHLWLRAYPASEAARLVSWGLAAESDPDLAELATRAPGAVFSVAELAAARARLLHA
jgi:hypothetical protein